MTKKKNLTAFMIAIMVILFSFPANAQEKKGYAQYDENSNTLTFYGGESVPTDAYALNTGITMPGWISDVASSVASSCTNVVFDSSFKDVRPKSCCFWFQGFSKLSTIKDIEYLNTDSVTTMHAMFYGCSGLTTLDVSKFNTAKVTHMTFMFSGCSGLTSLDVSKFNTANVEYMYHMFNGCSGLTSLNLSSFNTAKVGLMYNMFNDCSGLTSLDLSSFNTANVTDMSYMFANCSKLTSLNVSNFNTAKVTTMYYMFFNCSTLDSLNVSNFNTDNVTTMYYMFYKCSKLESLDVSSFNTANVTNMSSMFSKCSKLESLNVSKFNTAKVTGMSSMFSECSGLTSLDLSSFNTAKVTTMYHMFDGCSGLTTIYASDYFTTDKVNNSTGMFGGCSKLVGAASYSDSGATDKDMANYKTGYFKTYFTLGGSKVELCGKSTSLDLSGDKDFVAHAPFTVNTATYTRNLSTSGSTWFSLCLPFAYTPQNFTAYQLQSANGDAVEIEQMTGKIVAGTPVLFKFKDGVEKKINITATDAQIVKAPVVDGTTVSDPNGSSLQLYGTYQEKTFSQQDNNTFIIYKDRLMNPANMPQSVTKVGVKPFHAYMTMTSSAGAKSFSIGSGDEGTTAIDLLNSVATGDAEYYDINGRRIDAPAKGVNIVRRGNKTMKLIIK